MLLSVQEGEGHFTGHDESRIHGVTGPDGVEHRLHQILGEELASPSGQASAMRSMTTVATSLGSSTTPRPSRGSLDHS